LIYHLDKLGNLRRHRPYDCVVVWPLLSGGEVVSQFAKRRVAVAYFLHELRRHRLLLYRLAPYPPCCSSSGPSHVLSHHPLGSLLSPDMARPGSLWKMSPLSGVTHFAVGKCCCASIRLLCG
jgi:hypothetical protein